MLLIGVGVFVVVGGTVAADDAASFNFSLFLFLVDFCLLEKDPAPQLRASEGPSEGRAVLSCCLNVDGPGIGGSAE